MARLETFYKEQVTKALVEKFGYKNPMEIPKISKIVINIGVGEAKDNPKELEAAIGDLEKITGQKYENTWLGRGNNDDLGIGVSTNDDGEYDILLEIEEEMKKIRNSKEGKKAVK